MSKEEIEKILRWLKTDGTVFLTDLTDIEKIEKYIDQLEHEVKATEKVHAYDIKMIDEVKGKAVRLYKKIDKQNKIIDEMTKYMSENIECDFITSTNKKCVNTDCKDCFKQYFEKKVEEKL